MKRILVIRMLEIGDVVSIAVPLLRHIDRIYSPVSIDFLTHGEGLKIAEMAMPNLGLLHLDKHIWPDDILQAMEAFLGLAEQIVGQDYDEILNLDTAFMPCFLARFLKDAGQPVKGNMLSISTDSLINQIQLQTLTAEYVNNASQYLTSTFTGMYKWHTQWWNKNPQLEYGYAEYYLRDCCGFSSIQMDSQIEIEPLPLIVKRNPKRLIIMLSLRESNLEYKLISNLQKQLENCNFDVFLDDTRLPIQERLSQISVSNLLVCFPGAAMAMANAVNVPILLVQTEMDPRIFMPDYATEKKDGFPTAEELVEGIKSINIEQ